MRPIDPGIISVCFFAMLCWPNWFLLPALPLFSFSFLHSLLFIRNGHGEVVSSASGNGRMMAAASFDGRSWVKFAANSSNTPDEHLRELAGSSLDNGQPLIQPLNAFFEHFMAAEDSVDRPVWDWAVPNEAERRQMRELIHFLFRLDDFYAIASNATFLPQFAPFLAKWVQLTFLRQAQFCVVHERLPPTWAGHFLRFWGYLVLCSPAHCFRPILHHSAAHFQSDGNVCNQSAAIFERTSSRSLVVAGASRYAVRGRAQSTCQPKYAMADAAHDNRTMFHTMCTSLLEAARNAPEGMNATFIQWHGMAANSCAASDGFISIGANGSHPIYRDQNATVNRASPVDILVRTGTTESTNSQLCFAVNRLAGGEVINTPAEDSKCKLIASTNVFGRIVNGVSRSKSCSVSAKPKDVKGQFIHIEQKRILRDNWSLWTTSINEAFAVVKTNDV